VESTTCPTVIHKANCNSLHYTTEPSLWRFCRCPLPSQTPFGRRTIAGGLKYCTESLNRSVQPHLLLRTPLMSFLQGIAENDEIVAFVRVCSCFLSFGNHLTSHRPVPLRRATLPTASLILLSPANLVRADRNILMTMY